MTQLVRKALLGVALAGPAVVLAGPPYVSDDPEPTDRDHYEIYFFDSGSGGVQGVESRYGMDFNYGAAKDLQLTATIAFAYDRATGDARGASGLSNIELAAKYRFLHQDEIGWDVSFFPRVVLPSPSARFGERHAALLLPFWMEKDWDNGWSTFGGGGCEWNRGGDSKDFCLAGWAVTHQFLPALQLGAELVHQTADTQGGHASTGPGIGMKFDMDERWHLLAYAGQGLEDVGPNPRYSWYTSILLTF